MEITHEATELPHDGHSKYRQGCVSGLLRLETKEPPDYIEKILTAECYTWPNYYPRKSEIEERYEKSVSLITGALATHLGLSKEERNEPQKLKEAVAQENELSLYQFIKSLLYDAMKISYKADSTISSSMLENRFNCFTASILVWDAMKRMGKEMQGVLTGDHFFLIGDDYAFDVVSPASYVYSKRMVPIMYKNDNYELINDMANGISGIAYYAYAARLVNAFDTKPDHRKIIMLSKASFADMPEPSKWRAKLALTALLIRKHRMGYAKRVLEDILDKDPKNEAATLPLIRLLVNEKNFKEAIDGADRFARAGGNSYRVLETKAMAQFESGNRKDAYTTCKEIMRRGESPYALSLMAYIIQEKRPKKAIRILDRIAKMEAAPKEEYDAMIIKQARELLRRSRKSSNEAQNTS